MQELDGPGSIAPIGFVNGTVAAVDSALELLVDPTATGTVSVGEAVSGSLFARAVAPARAHAAADAEKTHAPRRRGKGRLGSGLWAVRAPGRGIDGL